MKTKEGIKMLKGTMTIEMTDVNTGRTEKVLEQNMVTNALSEIFKPLGLAKDPGTMLNSFAPYYQKLLGGILLFDREIEENPNNIFPPAEANLIGCAAYGNQNNTKGTKRGGYNQTESELNLADRYMKFVYDFTTSQANGTISSVCLTHVNGGYTSYGGADAVLSSNYPLGIRFDDGSLQYVYSSYTGATTGDKYSGYTVGKTELLFLIDRATDMAYYFRMDNAETITIVKRRAYLKSVSVLTSPYTKKEYVDEVQIDGLNLQTSNISYNFDHADNCLYICSSANGHCDADGTFNITKIAFGNWAVTEYTVTNTTNVRLGTGGMYFAFCHHGFVYVKSYNSPYELYKLEIATPANVVKMKRNTQVDVNGYPRFAVNGRIYYENYSNSYQLHIANEATEEILNPENGYIYNNGNRLFTYTPLLNEPMVYYLSCGDYTTVGFIILANYLATINNLSEPVTKTVDKTMKVTYIIQEQ